LVNQKKIGEFCLWWWCWGAHMLLFCCVGLWCWYWVFLGDAHGGFWWWCTWWVVLVFGGDAVVSGACFWWGLLVVLWWLMVVLVEVVVLVVVMLFVGFLLWIWCGLFKVQLHGFLVGLMVILERFFNGFVQDLFLLLRRRINFGFWRWLIGLVSSFYWFRGPQWWVLLVCL